MMHPNLQYRISPLSWTKPFSYTIEQFFSYEVYSISDCFSLQFIAKKNTCINYGAVYSFEGLTACSEVIKHYLSQQPNNEQWEDLYTPLYLLHLV